MKKYIALAVVIAMSLSGLAFGIGETPVVESVAPPRACTGVQTRATGTTQAVLTIPALSGFYIYICTYDEFVGATTAPAATFLTTTTTNLGGLAFYNQVAATATASNGIHFIPQTAYQSAQPGVPVTITTNAAVTSVNYGSTVTYFYAKPVI